MHATETHSPPVSGALWVMFAMLMFSVNDVLIKDLSSDYALHEAIFVRSFVGLAVLVGVALAQPDSRSLFRTSRPVIHIFRGLCIVFANLLFFLGLTAMPLADAVAVFFIAPTVIAVFSVLFLGEKVGPRRWAAIAVGLIGVLIVLRPGTEAFKPAALLPLAAAFAYATVHTLTRRIGNSESAITMAMAIQAIFLITSAGFGLGLADGKFDTFDHPSAQFLLRAWSWPEPLALLKMATVGVTSAMGGLAISQAYRSTEAAYVAPFEYVAMPISVAWGWFIFAEWPDNWTWTGIALIIGSGLVLIWREAVARRQSGALQRPIRR